MRKVLGAGSSGRSGEKFTYPDIVDAVAGSSVDGVVGTSDSGLARRSVTNGKGVKSVAGSSFVAAESASTEPVTTGLWWSRPPLKGKIGPGSPLLRSCSCRRVNRGYRSDPQDHLKLEGG